MCKKGLSVLVLLSLWMCLTGFASLGEEGKDTWNSMMEQLSAEEIDQLLAEENEWYGKVMANVEDSVTIRAEASTESAAVGKMFKGDAGEILEQQEGWTRIQSGDVDGWVSDEYLAFGKDAEERAEEDVPQLVNILKGDMSIVGNRPLPLYEAELLTSDEYIDRFMGPAGLTGLWQVEKRGSSGKLSADERKQLDIKYAQTFSFLLDMEIILRTFTAFIQKENV